jgi:hypothetical protein
MFFEIITYKLNPTYFLPLTVSSSSYTPKMSWDNERFPVLIILPAIVGNLHGANEEKRVVFHISIEYDTFRLYVKCSLKSLLIS